jgi:hypothetical protein
MAWVAGFAHDCLCEHAQAGRQLWLVLSKLRKRTSVLCRAQLVGLSTPTLRSMRWRDEATIWAVPGHSAGIHTCLVHLALHSLVCAAGLAAAVKAALAQATGTSTAIGANLTKLAAAKAAVSVHYAKAS